jgi:hypothetical protein
MFRRVFSLAVALMALSMNSIRAEEFTTLVGWDGQLYPSFLLSTATVKNAPWIDTERTDLLGDRGGLLGIRVTASEADTAIKVTVTCNEIMEPSTFSGTLEEADLEYTVLPKIKYKFAKLAEISQATPISMTFKVQIGDNEATEETATVTVRPVNDCPYFVQIGEDQHLDISPTFAAYVNEQHPFLDKILREALDVGVVEAFSGYQGDEAEVIRQVYALWDALVARDVRYSSITATAVESDTVYSQHVRLIDESINNAQANCVDGSVLFASLLRKIGIDPFLVLVPGHCYVGFYVDSKHEAFMCLETTMLGSSVAEDEDYTAVDKLEEAVDEESRGDSFATFSNAIAAGSGSFEENRAKFDDLKESNYVMIDIAKARKAGMLPIAFRGTEEFKDVASADDEEAATTDDSEEE